MEMQGFFLLVTKKRNKVQKVSNFFAIDATYKPEVNLTERDKGSDYAML